MFAPSRHVHRLPSFLSRSSTTRFPTWTCSTSLPLRTPCSEPKSIQLQTITRWSTRRRDWTTPILPTACRPSLRSRPSLLFAVNQPHFLQLPLYHLDPIPPSHRGLPLACASLQEKLQFQGLRPLLRGLSGL